MWAKRTALAVAALLLFACEAKETNEQVVLRAWSAITVGVADLDIALQLWNGEFGFEITARREGPDDDLARLWGIAADDIARQAILRTPGADLGRLHLVEFNNPGPPVRQNAQVFDLCPKNLDIYVDDMAARVAELKRAGYTFRNDKYSEVTAPNGITFREIHMPAHDDVNVVLLQVIGKEYPFTDRGYAGIGPLIAIVGDAGAERSFYETAFGMEKLSDNILQGPEIERMVGLPPGAALVVSIWGAAGEHLGQMEIINYQGVDGNNLFPKATPKSLGILHITFIADDLSSVQAHLDSLGIRSQRHDAVATLLGSGEAITTRSPAGLRIDIIDGGD